MDQLFSRTRMAGILGTVTSSAGWLAGEFIHGLLGNLLMLVALLTAIISLTYMVLINRNKNITKAIEKARAEIKLCADCLNGNPPAVCPLPECDRPKLCPRKKQLTKLGKLWNLIYGSEETTTL